MKKVKPTKHHATVLYQLCKLIPSHLTTTLARKHGVDKRARTFTPWSHVVALLYVQLTHSISLNDVCDALCNHASKLFAIRGAKAPARNTLACANRKRKAAAKMHMRLNLQTFLPGFVIVEEASHHDDTRAVELCSDLQAGEIAVFDKAYVNFKHLYALGQRGVFWVLRAKDNMAYRVHRKRIKKPEGNILRDDIIHLKSAKSRKEHPVSLRRVEAKVEVDGKEVVMVFITNNFEWAASSVCDLYKSRWGIEAFFKQLKQTCQRQLKTTLI